MELIAIAILVGGMNIANAIADSSPHCSNLNRSYYNFMTLVTWVALLIASITY